MVSSVGRRGAVLSLTSLLLFVLVLMIVYARIQALCCVEEVRKLELRLAEEELTSTNFEGLLFYNIERAFYAKPLRSLRDRGYFASEVKRLANTLAERFSSETNFTFKVIALHVSSLYVLGSAGADSAWSLHYPSFSNCYNVRIEYAVEGGEVKVNRSTIFVVCHPARYLQFQAVVRKAAGTMKNKIYNATEVSRSLQSYLRERLSGFTLKFSERNESSFYIVYLKACDVLAEDGMIWRDKTPCFKASFIFERIDGFLRLKEYVIGG